MIPSANDSIVVEPSFQISASATQLVALTNLTLLGDGSFSGHSFNISGVLELHGQSALTTSTSLDAYIFTGVTKMYNESSINSLGYLSLGKLEMEPSAVISGNSANIILAADSIVGSLVIANTTTCLGSCTFNGTVTNVGYVTQIGQQGYVNFLKPASVSGGIVAHSLILKSLLTVSQPTQVGDYSSSVHNLVLDSATLNSSTPSVGLIFDGTTLNVGSISKLGSFNVTGITVAGGTFTIGHEYDASIPLSIGQQSSMIFASTFTGALSSLSVQQGSVTVEGSLAVDSLTATGAIFNVVSGGNLVVCGAPSQITQLTVAGKVTFDTNVAIGMLTHSAASAVTTVSSGVTCSSDISITAGTLQLNQGSIVTSATLKGATLKLPDPGVVSLSQDLSLDIFSSILFNDVQLAQPYCLQVLGAASLSGSLSYKGKSTKDTGRYNLIYSHTLSGSFVSVAPADTQEVNIVYSDTYVYVAYTKSPTSPILTWLYVLVAFVILLTVLVIGFVTVKLVSFIKKRKYTSIAG